jgi:hypothetical protein
MSEDKIDRSCGMAIDSRLDRNSDDANLEFVCLLGHDDWKEMCGNQERECDDD